MSREEGENVCRFEYDGDELDGHELSGGGGNGMLLNCHMCQFLEKSLKNTLILMNRGV